MPPCPAPAPLRRRLAGITLAAACLWSACAGAEPSHGFSPLGVLRYPVDFRHFDCVNPAAPKGGTLRLARIGSFDSTNTLRYPGNTPAEIRTMVFDRLLALDAGDGTAGSRAAVAPRRHGRGPAGDQAGSACNGDLVHEALRRGPSFAEAERSAAFFSHLGVGHPANRN
jgi:hypothetical protein